MYLKGFLPPQCPSSQPLVGLAIVMVTEAGITREISTLLVAQMTLALVSLAVVKLL